MIVFPFRLPAVFFRPPRFCDQLLFQKKHLIGGNVLRHHDAGADGAVAADGDAGIKRTVDARARMIPDIGCIGAVSRRFPAAADVMAAGAVVKSQRPADAGSADV